MGRSGEGETGRLGKWERKKLNAPFLRMIYHIYNFPYYVIIIIE
jgi:hypothetical protein